jgi:peptidoglycan/xylan/chitin deacetylase (PgdA/CDA1 family)
MYHRVMPTEESSRSYSNPAIIVSESLFDQHLSILKKHFNVVNISQYLNNKQTDDGKPKCLITFDDGWQDNYRYALPLLQKHRLPALIFLPVDYIDADNLFWQERMARTISELLLRSDDDALNLASKHQLDALKNSHREIMKQSILRHVNTMKSRPYTDIDALYREIIDCLGRQPDFDVDRYLTWDQVKEMGQQNIFFGSHACSHRILPRLTTEEVEKELSTSFDQIESHLSEAPLTIAYPNGDSSPTIQQQAKARDYQAGFGTRPGHNIPGEDMFDLRRININTQKTLNKPLFFMCILGLI